MDDVGDRFGSATRRYPLEHGLFVGLRPRVTVATFGRVPKNLRKLLVAIVLLGSIGTELAFAEPLRTTAMFRKLACCARNCATLGGAACQPDCCSPARQRESATISSAADRSQPSTLVAIPVIAPVDIAPSIERPERVSFVFARGDPRSLLLITQSLRL